MPGDHSGGLWMPGEKSIIDDFLNSRQALSRAAGPHEPFHKPTQQTVKRDVLAPLRKLLANIQPDAASPSSRQAVEQLIREAVERAEGEHKEGDSWWLWRDLTHPFGGR